MAYALGIDLGTTFTAAGIARDDGVVEAVTLGERSVSIPSVVLLRDGGEVLVGEAADRRSLHEPTRTAREFKRRLGDPVPMIVGSTPYGAEALIAHLLAAVVERVTEREGAPPARVAITHPASWGGFKTDLLQQAVRQAGLEGADLLAEPEAAAIEYASLERLDVGAVLAVYDFGGGTFDAAVLRRTADGFDLLGNPEGLERLGGIDVDQALLVHVDAALGGRVAELDVADPTAAAALSRLAAECRAAKEALSSDTDAVVTVSLPTVQTEVRITRAELETMLRPRLGETVAALRRAIASAGLGVDDVDRVLLVGGTSRVPLVAQYVREELGRPTAVDANPKLAVCLGAARWARAQLAPADTGRTAPPAPEQPDRPPHARRRPIFVAAAVGAAALGAVVLGAFAMGAGNEEGRHAAGLAATNDDDEPPASSTSTSAAATTSTDAEPRTSTTSVTAELATVVDDTGSFAVDVPATFATNTTLLDLGGTPVAHVSGSPELAAYLAGDWSTVGTTVLVADRTDAGSLGEILNLFNPGDACATHSARDPYSTALGSGLLQRFDACGPGGSAGQVLAAIDVPSHDAVLLVGTQAPGSADALAQPLFDVVIASVTPLA